MTPTPIYDGLVCEQYEDGEAASVRWGLAVGWLVALVLIVAAVVCAVRGDWWWTTAAATSGIGFGAFLTYAEVQLARRDNGWLA